MDNTSMTVACLIYALNKNGTLSEEAAVRLLIRLGLSQAQISEIFGLNVIGIEDLPEQHISEKESIVKTPNGIVNLSENPDGIF